MENLHQDSHFMDPDLNLQHPECETEVLLSHFQCPKKCKQNKDGIYV
jgi:hypothetical protein